MKKSIRFEKIYLGIVFLLMYLPVAVVIIFSFNESKLPVRLTGFSLQWDCHESIGKQRAHLSTSLFCPL